MKAQSWHTSAGLAVLVAASCASAQVVTDGNMDNLAVGNPPDQITPAGAWGFPAFYITNLVAEPLDRTGIFSIVPTSSFQTGGVGNSLHLVNPAGGADNFHLPNIWAQTFQATPGLVLRVSFRFWVNAGSGGGSIYVGGDNGGGGFSNATGDRTAQLSWTADGQVNYANNAGVNIPIQAYSFGAWQNVQIDIDTDARNYDLFWSMGSDPLTQIGDNIMFRAPNPALSVNYDRITYVQFGATIPAVDSYLDDIVVAPVTGCRADFNGDNQVDFFDYLDFAAAFDAEDESADFNGDNQVDFFDYLDFAAAFDAQC
jgi:hypothetical protein